MSIQKTLQSLIEKKLGRPLSVDEQKTMLTIAKMHEDELNEALEDESVAFCSALEAHFNKEED